MSRLPILLVVSMLASLAAPAMALAQGAVVERGATASALVHDVDLTTRQVLLETEDGRFLTVVAPPEVRNLPQLKVGDTVTITYFETVLAELAPAGSGALPAVADVAMVRAAEGERPGAAFASELVMTVTFNAFNAETGVATYTSEDGIQRQIELETPEMRDFAGTLEPGDLVDVSIIEVLAITTEPMAE